MLVENIPCLVHHHMHNPSKMTHAVVLLAEISGASKLEQQLDEVLALLKAQLASEP